MKEELEKKASAILEDLGIKDYYKDKPFILKKRRIKIFDSKGHFKEELGWSLTVSAPNWQFNNDQGVYGINFLLDGTPYRIGTGTGGRPMYGFITKDENGKYKAVATVEEI